MYDTNGMYTTQIENTCLLPVNANQWDSSICGHGITHTLFMLGIKKTTYTEFSPNIVMHSYIHRPFSNNSPPTTHVTQAQDEKHGQNREE